MALRLLPIGTSTPIIQNEVYALPSKLCRIATSIACQVSVDGIAWNAFTSDTETASEFIRCITGNAVVICKSSEIAAGSLSLLRLAQLTSDPPPPLVGANIWLSNNASGKTRLFIQFKTGARIRLAIEP